MLFKWIICVKHSATWRLFKSIELPIVIISPDGRICLADGRVDKHEINRTLLRRWHTRHLEIPFLGSTLSLTQPTQASCRYIVTVYFPEEWSLVLGKNSISDLWLFDSAGNFQVCKFMLAAGKTFQGDTATRPLYLKMNARWNFQNCVLFQYGEDC